MNIHVNFQHVDDDNRTIHIYSTAISELPTLVKVMGRSGFELSRASCNTEPNAHVNFQHVERAYTSLSILSTPVCGLPTLVEAMNASGFLLSRADISKK